MVAPAVSATDLDVLDPARLESRSTRDVLPWTRDALIRLAAGNGVGLLLITLGWYQSSGQTSLGSAVGWFELGIAGLVVAGISNGLWLLRGRRTIGLARVALLEQFAPTRGVGEAHDELDSAGASHLVALPDSHRYHRAGCPMVSGKPVTAITHEVQFTDRTPCEVCRP